MLSVVALSTLFFHTGASVAQAQELITPITCASAGDFNGDGKTDIALVRQESGWNTVPVALSGDTGFTIQNRPVGDFASWAATSGVRVICR